MSNTTRNFKWLAQPYLLWCIGFTVIPLLVIIRYALTDETGRWTWSNIAAIIDPIHSKAFWFSLEIAVGCTLICILLAYPLVLAFRRLNLSRGKFLLYVLILPMWMNFILRLLAWQMLLSNNGIINNLLMRIGLEPLKIANTGIAIMIGVIYEYLPFMVLPVYNSVMQIDRGVVEAAQDLGAGPFRTFFKVIFPLSIPGLKSGITMVFIPAMTSFVIADILGGGRLQLIGNVIEQEFNHSMNWHLGSGLSVALMVFVLVSMALTMKSENTYEEDGKQW